MQVLPPRPDLQVLGIDAAAVIAAVTDHVIVPRHHLVADAEDEAVAAQDPDRQTAEIEILIALMNRFSAPGTAEIVRVA